METAGLKVVNVSLRVQTRGGIETLLALNRTLPFSQMFVAVFDRAPESRPDYHNLNVNGRTTLGAIRRKFAAALAPYAGSVVVYHNAWALPLLHQGDAAARRLAFLYAMPDFHAREVAACAGLIDGGLGISPGFSASLLRMAPELGGGRTVDLPLPIEVPAELGSRRGGGEIVLGYSGRIERLHKRLDRLPDFLHALDATGLRYRFEVLGEGTLRPELERRLGDRVRFHGWADKADFWRILGGWDGIVFFTEVEGGPIAMLEGMRAGVIPFFPRIGGSAGDFYAPQVDPLCHYPRGDIAALAASVHRIFTQHEGRLAELRARAEALVAHHTAEGYRAVLTDYLARASVLPRIGAPGAPMRRRWSDGLPYGLVKRLAPWLLWQH